MGLGVWDLTSAPAGGDTGLDEGMSSAGLGGPGWVQVLVLVQFQEEAGVLLGSPDGSELLTLGTLLWIQGSSGFSESRFLLRFLHSCSSCSELLLRAGGLLLSCNAPPSSSMDRPLWETLCTGTWPSAGWGEEVQEVFFFFFFCRLTAGPEENVHHCNT